jgi:hypothetical protein
MSWQNIDKTCAKIGFNIPQSKDSKNTIQKALGILMQDGIFAYIIWLESRGSLKPSQNNIDEATAKKIHEESYLLLKQVNLLSDNTNYTKLKDKLTEVNGILEDIHKMFLVKQVLERMLTYALYRAKSLE